MVQANKKNEFLYDKRVAERHVSESRVTRQEIQEFIDKLPDLEGSCEDIGEEIYSAEEKPKVTLHDDFVEQE